MENASEPRSHRAEGKQQGSCHCGAVRFEVRLEPGSKGSRCNCSICSKTGVTSFLVKPESFTLLTPEADLRSYEQGFKISKRYFCPHCGIHCFGRGHLPEVGGDYVSINANCLDDLEPTTIESVYWDGRHNNWEAGPRDRPWPTHA
ncbi:MAG TPA: GFA family protein [Polyangiaceae bacterium]|nr:GFA family protein [Polyangiaceae bacterium]